MQTFLPYPGFVRSAAVTALDEVRAILDRLGFVDATDRVNPHADRLLADADKLTTKDGNR